MYKLVNYENQLVSIKLTKENTKELFIPLDPDNTDYQEYLAWVAEGNTPEEAE